VKDQWPVYKTESSNQEFINENWNLLNSIIKVNEDFFLNWWSKHSYVLKNKQYNLYDLHNYWTF